MKAAISIVRFSVNHPRLIAALVVGITAVLALLAGLPSVWPETFSYLHAVKVDTDPENMLSQDEAVRVFHHEMKTALSLHDMVVVGVVNETHPNGVFNPESLRNIDDLTRYCKTLKGAALGQDDPNAGVIGIDLIAPSTMDNIEQGGVGEVRFEWLMAEPPVTEADALAIRDKARRIPFLDGTLVSEDGKAIALYLPLTSKDLSSKVYSRLRAKIAEYQGAERYYITGLPVAEDVFGVEMFKQMAISAPLAMLVIFLLMLVFFRKLLLIVSPMILAMVAVICTMGLLIATGNTIHIMSSMIPIFIMPIAVLDSIHILSEFFDRYQQTRDRKKTALAVMDNLFVPMLYTSLTSAAGFASLALTPIPPVQVFGIFVAIGIMLAWGFTVTFIPAFIMFIPERKLENFGARHISAEEDEKAQAATALGRMLRGLGTFTTHHSKLILALSGAAVVLAGYGISKIQINDNPIKWFEKSHPIRIADTVLNSHFGGTYMAYLALRPADAAFDAAAYGREMAARLDAFRDENAADVPELAAAASGLAAEIPQAAARHAEKADLLTALDAHAQGQAAAAEGDLAYAWDELRVFLDRERQRDEVFKQPEVLRYLEQIQANLLTSGVVGKSNSLSDIVKTVYRELIDGQPENFRIPGTANAVAQCLAQYQSSHRPQDLSHFVTPDYRTTSLWVQLKSGDNKDMAQVVAAVEEFIAQNPPPVPLEHEWFGLTYINVIWQDKMVSGMLQSFLGSFLIVMLMMVILFRSGLWGLYSMVPLTITIGLIYGVLGLAGKDYDMPVAVLSALTLGLAVDFAIHFLARAQDLHTRYGTWTETSAHMFGEPARAITRNVIVIAVGFTPLLAAPLVPYQTVGVLLGAILLLSGISTLVIMPALVTVSEKLMFPKKKALCLACNCTTCVVSAALAVATVAINVHQFFEMGWTRLTIWSLIALPILAGLCAITARREKCRRDALANAQAACDKVE